MIRRVVASAFTLLLLAAVPVAAQSPVGVFGGGGVLLPALDYADYHDTGWAASGGIWKAVGEKGLGLLGEGFYGSNNHNHESVGEDGEKQTLYGIFGGATYRIGDPESKGFFLMGKAGLLVRNSDHVLGDKDNKFAGGAGVGFILPKETASTWILAQFIGAKCTKFFVIGVGFTAGGR